MALTKLTDGVRGTITNAQISDLPTSKLTGTVADSQIVGMASSKLTGTLTNAQIAAMAASKLTGALPTIDGSNLTGVASDISNLQTNLALNFFLDAVDHARSIQNLQDGWTDQFEDQAGVDNNNSVSETYDSSTDFYGPSNLTIDESHLSGTGDQALGDAGAQNEFRVGQSFTISQTGVVTKVDVRHGTKYLSPSGNVTLRIETDNSDRPSGTLAHANATHTLNPSSANTVYSYTFASSFTLTGSTKYWLVFDCDDQAQNTRWSVSCTTDSDYAGGKFIGKTDGVWQTPSASIDVHFKVFCYCQTKHDPNGRTRCCISRTCQGTRYFV